MLFALIAYTVKYAAAAHKRKAVLGFKMLFNIAHKFTFKMHKSSAFYAFNVDMLVAAAAWLFILIHGCFIAALSKFKQHFIAD